MIYTCCHKNYVSNYYRTYAISGNRGKDANYTGEVCSLLAPKFSFWKIWHDNIGVITEEENTKYYIKEYYRQVLEKLDVKEIYQKLDNSILLCYEESDEFCHRHIVAEWFQILLNVEIPEVKVNGQIIEKTKRPEYIRIYLMDIMQEEVVNYENKNIIFLDVDGVLNSISNLIKVYEKTHRQHSGYNYPFDEKCLENLRLLVEETNSKIVITSTWRRNEKGIKKLLEILSNYHLDKEVIGYTPILNKSRGEEIKKYLSSLDYNPNFIIIDDDNDMGELLPYLINTNNYYGLTSEDANNGIKILNKKVNK